MFSDELNHASIIDGARLAGRTGAAVHVYRHNDLAHLERLLVACPSGRRRLVVTDSLFSMDGARLLQHCSVKIACMLQFVIGIASDARRHLAVRADSLFTHGYGAPAVPLPHYSRCSFVQVQELVCGTLQEENFPTCYLRCKMLAKRR